MFSQKLNVWFCQSWDINWAWKLFVFVVNVLREFVMLFLLFYVPDNLPSLFLLFPFFRFLMLIVVVSFFLLIFSFRFMPRTMFPFWTVRVVFAHCVLLDVKWNLSNILLVSCLSELFYVCANVQDTSQGQFCLRPPAVPKSVKPQLITLLLKGSFVSVSWCRFLLLKFFHTAHLTVGWHITVHFSSQSFQATSCTRQDLQETGMSWEEVQECQRKMIQ